jgi:pimeloyl-ACP methyl ester carboxylesterase
MRACDHHAMRSNDNSRRAVCVHGAGGGGWEWTVWGRVLVARGWGVLAPDLQPASTGIAATRLHDYVAQVSNWCAVQPPDLLIGASLGGLLALAVAAEVRPRALVLVNPLPPLCFEAESAGAGAESLSMSTSAREQSPAIVPWGSSRSLASTRRALPDADDATCLAVFRHWRDESGAALNAAIGGIAVVRPSCPVLVLGSEDDDDVAPAAVQALTQLLKADFELLRQASHVGPLLGRGAGAIAQRVADWSEQRFSEHNTR